jgi:hypothetical protein
MIEQNKLKKGDVFQLNDGNAPEILYGKYFRVEKAKRDGTIELSQPFLDAELTKPFLVERTPEQQARFEAMCK